MMMYKKIEELDAKEMNGEFRKKSYKKLKAMIPPNWKRVGYQVSQPEGYKEFNGAEVRGKAEVNFGNDSLSDFFPEGGEKNETYLEEMNKTYFNSGVIVEGEGRDIHVNYNLDEGNPYLQDLNLIRVGSGEKVNIIFEYQGNPSGGFRNSVTKVVAEENSEINLINLQVLGDGVESFNSVEIKAGARAKVNQYNFELGGRTVIGNTSVYLEEDNVQTNIYSLYVADGDKKVDLEYSSHHEGRRGESLIEGRGVVKDRAVKVFRGNLHFEKGSGKSVGREIETALLMNREVKADSIPTLFCKEDDVVGEHAASAGQLNQEKLFYLMSRGLNEKEAKRMVTISSFKPILEKIENKDIEKKILDYIEKRI